MSKSLVQELLSPMSQHFDTSFSSSIRTTWGLGLVTGRESVMPFIDWEWISVVWKLRGFYPDNVQGKSVETALHALARQNRYDLGSSDVDILRKRGADVNARDGKGRTPLHILLERPGIFGTHSLAVAYRLLDLGADLNAEDNLGCTPWCLFLGRYRPNPDVQGLCGETVLHILVKGSRNRAILTVIDKLRDLGADINIQNDKDYTALRYLFTCHFERNKKATLSIAYKLLDVGADPNVWDDTGHTPWHL